MSLLNDALRAAEERQNRPVAPGAYVGEPQPRNRRPLLVALLVLVLLVAGISGYGILAGSSSPEPAVTESKPSSEKPVHRGSGEPTPQLEVVKPVPVQKRELTPEPVAVPREATEPSEPETKQLEAKQPEVAEPEPVGAPSSAVAEAPDEQPSVAPEESQPQQASTSGVKQVPETPAATDRGTARELERLVAKGKINEAERRLAALTREQPAPRSRYVVARALLVAGKQDQALGWLPVEVVASHARLRLLRARALHANKDLVAALNTLTANVPPVEDHAEYRVTLATLLQQQGESAEAARHWAELIAWDDSQAPWWVGLAISLEAQGEEAGAARAYLQAAELPGLPPSLADYVRQRLQALRAG